MSPDLIVQLLRDALLSAFWIAAPLLMLGFSVGIVVSLLQIVTSIQDPAFNSIPRLLAFLAGIVTLMPWMLSRSSSYTIQLLGDLGKYAR
jgi:flagellar biosynthetic protein FliQ